MAAVAEIYQHAAVSGVTGVAHANGLFSFEEIDARDGSVQQTLFFTSADGLAVCASDSDREQVDIEDEEPATPLLSKRKRPSGAGKSVHLIERAVEYEEAFEDNDDDDEDADEDTVTVTAAVALSSPTRARRKNTPPSPAKRGSPSGTPAGRKRSKGKARQHFLYEEVLTITVGSDGENEEVDIDC